MVPQSNLDGSTKADQTGHEPNINTDVQSYLISNYREALKKGDKSAAKSCLLAARYFSVNDPNVTNEIYMMAKSDGDVSEASKCFANMFNDIFMANGSGSPKNHTNESSVVINQIKDEIRLLLNDLKSHHLKLKSSQTPASAGIRQTNSVSQSPMLSPRLRMSSEDRAASRESLSRLDSHLHSKTTSFFYQQLFDNLPKDVKSSILDHSIDTCDNPLERCRLMMLSISIFSDSVSKYGSQLISTLTSLSEPDVATRKKLMSSCPPMVCQYAKSLLVLDAIPLIFSAPESENLDFEIEELLSRTLSYYSEFYLENIASEYEFDELHEGLKKTIAARILGKENNSTADDSMEDNLVTVLNLLFDRYIHLFSSDSDATNRLKNLRLLIADKSSQTVASDRIIELFKSLELAGVPSSLIENPSKEKMEINDVTPPPKARGRPKKSQTSVIVSPDNEMKRHYYRAREANFVFYSIIQYMFVNCAKYLKQTRSRVLLKFDNPLSTLIESELARTSNQRTSRSKHLNNDFSTSPSKKIKVEVSPAKSIVHHQKDSPLNSEQSKMMDLAMIRALSEAHKCLDFLDHEGCIKSLWSLLKSANAGPNFDELNWFNRITADSMIMTGQYEMAVETLDTIVYEKKDEPLVKKGHIDAETSTLTIMTGSPPVGVYHLRALTQLISCHVQMLDKIETYQCIDELLSKIKQAGLLTNDENYSTGNIINEYMVIIQEQQSLGFLFFDTLSIVRYCVDVLMEILRRHVVCLNSTSDTVVGHIIVLSQFDWPKETPIYVQCINWLRANKPKSTTPQCLSASTKFTYSEFFNYILNPNIIEDFMAMLNQGYTLDIKSSHGSSFHSSSHQNRSSNSSSGSLRGSSIGSSTRSGKAITTRGVNKTFKEDLKIALIAQMKQSVQLVPLDLISEFIQSSLIPFLNSTKK